MNSSKPPLRAALLVLALLTLLMAHAWSQETRVRRVGLLCAWESIPPVVVESALVQKLTAMRTAAKLARQALPVMQYALGSPEEQEYCREKLNIRLGNTPCLAVVTVHIANGVSTPDRLLSRIDQVTDPEVSATRIFNQALRQQQARQPVGILVVWNNHHPIVPDAMAQVRRLAPQEGLVREVERLTLERMRRGGFADRQLPVVRAQFPAMAAWLERLGLRPGQMPLAGLVMLDATDRPDELLTHRDNLIGQRPAQVADSIAKDWAARLAQVRRPQSYAVSLRGPDGRYVRVEKPDGGPLSCQDKRPGERERFVLVDVDGGTLASGHAVALMTPSGLYVGIEAGPTGLLVARAREMGPTERFVIEKVGPPGPDPSIRSGDPVRLRAPDQASWAVEESDGRKLTCRPRKPGPQEIFLIDIR